MLKQGIIARAAMSRDREMGVQTNFTRICHEAQSPGCLFFSQIEDLEKAVTFYRAGTCRDASSWRSHERNNCGSASRD